MQGDQEEEGAVGGVDDGGDVMDAVLNMPLPEAMQGPRPRRRPPREEWIVNQGLYPQRPAAAAGPPVAQPEDVPGRVRRNTKPPEYLGIEKDRGDCAALSDPQLPDSPPTQTEREFSPDGPTPAGSCSPTPPATPQMTPIVTPETSPDTSTVALPGRPHSPSWLSNHAILPRADPSDVLEVNRHWSFGGGETEQWRPYPMLDWTPLARRPPPSF